MKYRKKVVPFFIVLAGLALTLLAFEVRAAEGFQHGPPRHTQLGDYDSEPRLADGHVDVEKLGARLSELGVNTYYFLLWHAVTDWEDLQKFLPIAAQKQIEVWAYVVPPSESPANGEAHYSEPFRLDFPKWAEAIAKLSLTNTNLTGWVIDDFFINHKLFTPDYVRDMQARAKAINPRLAFFPLMYFGEVTRAFARDYHNVIDGVVVAYPQDRTEIEQARSVLNDDARVARSEFSFPHATVSKAGDFAMASQYVKVTGRKQLKLSFSEQDDFTGPTSGYHYKQVLWNGAVVWEQDVAGGSNGWNKVEFSVPATAAGRATLAFRLYDKMGVGNFGVRWRLADLKASGLKLDATFGQPETWRADQTGAFEGGFGATLQTPRHRWRIPFIVMTSGQGIEFRLRHGDPASAERMAQWLNMCVKAMHDGKCDGVVTYCLDKTDGSKVFELSKGIFHGAQSE
jgi:hypothetical protein